MAQQEMFPSIRVYVSAPTTEHQIYINTTGCIIDVRDFDEHHFCQVVLDDHQRKAIWFDVHELTID